MRITWLFEATDRIWGGVKVALEDANWLSARGHQVTVLSRTGPPEWLELQCGFQKVADFGPDNVPDSDVVIATFWTTVPAAVQAGRGIPVHYCQGYEGDNPEAAPYRGRIEAVYRMPEPARITISPHLTRILRDRFGIAASEVVYAVDHDTMSPGELRVMPRPVRVGIVGPYQIAWKDIATGLQACGLAARSGLDLQVVRVTNTEPHPDERQLPFPVEWHQGVRPDRMAEIYRSLDVFLGTSRGGEEGFFLPAVEAMACGVPCVLTDIPCFRGYGEGSYALFVPPEDHFAMAEALVVAGRLPDVRQSLRQAGLRTAARYHREAHGGELEGALAQIVAARNIAGPDVADADIAGGEMQVARARALYAAGRREESAQAFRAAIQSGTATAQVHNDLGVVLYACGDTDGARDSFRRALAANPDHADAQANLNDLSGARSGATPAASSI